MRQFRNCLGPLFNLCRAVRCGVPLALLLALFEDTAAQADPLPHGRDRTGAVTWSYGYNGVGQIELRSWSWDSMDYIAFFTYGARLNDFQSYDGNPTSGVATYPIPTTETLAGLDEGGRQVYQYSLDLGSIPLTSSVGLTFHFPTTHVELVEVETFWYKRSFRDLGQTNFVTVRAIPEPASGLAAAALLGVCAAMNRRTRT